MVYIMISSLYLLYFSLVHSPKYAIAAIKRKILDKNPHVAKFGLIVSVALFDIDQNLMLIDFILSDRFFYFYLFCK